MAFESQSHFEQKSHSQLKPLVNRRPKWMWCRLLLLSLSIFCGSLTPVLAATRIYPVEGTYNSQASKQGDSLSLVLPQGYCRSAQCLPAGTQLEGQIQKVRPATRFHHGRIVVAVQNIYEPGQIGEPKRFERANQPRLVLVAPSTLLDTRAGQHQDLIFLAELAVLPFSLRGIRSYVIPATTEALLGAALESISPTTKTPQSLFHRIVYGAYQGLLPLDPLYRLLKDKRPTQVSAENAVILKMDKRLFLQASPLQSQMVN